MTNKTKFPNGNTSKPAIELSTDVNIGIFPSDGELKFVNGELYQPYGLVLDKDGRAKYNWEIEDEKARKNDKNI